MQILIKLCIFYFFLKVNLKVNKLSLVMLRKLKNSVANEKFIYK